VYFDNDAKVRAPFDALALRRKLDLVPGCHDVRVAPGLRLMRSRRAASRHRRHGSGADKLV
jgi:hypothetical protein